MRRWIALTVLTLGVACSSGAPDAPEPKADGPWVGTITTEGNVTTVVNESGSVWGGTARLVEEASIGVEVGAPEYMLGEIRGLTANDQYIYVADASIPTVRVYDYEGRHVKDIGSRGGGPGEFIRPDKAAVADDGTLYLYGDGRVNIYSPTGESIDTWNFPRPNFSSSRSAVLTFDGTLYLPDRLRGAGGIADRRDGMRALGPDGPAEDMVLVPDFDAEPYLLVNEMRTSTGTMRSSTPVPFGPGVVWVMTPAGMIVAGLSSDYRFGFYASDGLRLAVEKAWTPVPVGADRAAWHRRQSTESFRRRNPEWQWNAPLIPETMPAYASFDAASDGRIWVRRAVAGQRRDNCDPEREDPETGRRTNCWHTLYEFDIFDEEGRFLGNVEYPPWALRETVMRGDHVIAYMEDESGTGMVKRYRLVLPGDEQQ